MVTLPVANSEPVKRYFYFVFIIITHYTSSLLINIHSGRCWFFSFHILGENGLTNFCCSSFVRSFIVCQATTKIVIDQTTNHTIQFCPWNCGVHRTMLKFWRLTDSLRKISLVEFSSLFQVNAKTATVMSQAATAATATTTAPIDKVAIDATKSVDNIENIEGTVKFLELVGNLKVRFLNENSPEIGSNQCEAPVHRWDCKFPDTRNQFRLVSFNFCLHRCDCWCKQTRKCRHP